jgi:hypothetical protein
LISCNTLYRRLQDLRVEPADRLIFFQRLKAATFMEAANARRRLGDYEGAVQAMMDARRLMGKLKDGPGMARVDLDLATLHLQAGQPTKAAVRLARLVASPLPSAYELRRRALTDLVDKALAMERSWS